MDLAALMGAQVGSGMQHGMQQLMGGMGAGGTDSPAYAKGADAGLSLLTKQLQARKLRDEEVARQSTLKKMSDAFPDMPPAQVVMMANTVIGGQGADFNATMSGMQTATETGLMNEGATAARGGNIDLANRLSSVRTGNPLERTKIDSGYAIDPYAPPTQPLVQTSAGAATEALTRERIDTEGVRQGDLADRINKRVNGGGKGAGGNTSDQYVTRKKIDAVFADYAPRIRGERSPEGRAQLIAERDQRVAEVTGASQNASTMSIDQAKQAAAQMAEAIKADRGSAITEGQRADLERQYRETGTAIYRENAEDGTTPPRVMDPATGVEATGPKGIPLQPRAGARPSSAPPAAATKRGGSHPSANQEPKTRAAFGSPRQQGEYDDFYKAQTAIARGAPYDEVVRRLRAAGYANPEQKLTRKR